MTPGISKGAESTARRIIEALRYGEAEVVTTLAGKAIVGFHGLFPGLTADATALINRLLPGPGGIGKERVKGYESISDKTPDWVQARNDQAARENNEM